MKGLVRMGVTQGLGDAWVLFCTQCESPNIEVHRPPERVVPIGEQRLHPPQILFSCRRCGSVDVTLQQQIRRSP